MKNQYLLIGKSNRKFESLSVRHAIYLFPFSSLKHFATLTLANKSNSSKKIRQLFNFLGHVSSWSGVLSISSESFPNESPSGPGIRFGMGVPAEHLVDNGLRGLFLGAGLPST
jgi:hypothetical protein